jgi:hypothetical protein
MSIAGKGTARKTADIQYLLSLLQIKVFLWSTALLFPYRYDIAPIDGTNQWPNCGVQGTKTDVMGLSAADELSR